MSEPGTDSSNARPRRARVRRIHEVPSREDVERELAAHLDLRTEELVSAGWDAAAARAEAQRLFGDYRSIRAECSEVAERHARSRRRSRMRDEIVADVRYALRGLVREPGFSVLAVLTLALGIGATTAAFGIVNGVLLAPLPYAEPDRLVAVRELAESGRENAVTWPNFRDWQAGTRTLSRLAAYQPARPETVLGGTEPVRAAVSRVSGTLFDVLGVRPAHGRTFLDEELVTGGPPTVLVSDAFWRQQLGARQDLSGLRLEALGGSAQVIGVMPRDFDFPGGSDIWFPLDIVDPASLGTRTAHNFQVVGRLSAGATIASASQELTGLTQQIRARESAITATGAIVHDLREDRVGGSRRALLILLGASAFVLLVACTNLASTLLARAARRGHELAIRSSLGAHRFRLVRQLLTESALLAGLGALMGLGLAHILIRVAVAFGTDAVPRLDTVHMDGRVLAFTMALAGVTALTFGTSPALRATSTPPHDGLREGGRGTDSRGQRRVWSALVGTEVALALLLLVGSGLLIRSFQTLLRVDPGFDPERQLAVQVSLPAREYGDGAARVQYYDGLLERVRALPGVESAAISWTVPLVDYDPNGTFYIEGVEGAGGNAHYRVVSPDFFETMRTPLVRGRTFTTADRAGAQDVIIINERMADQFFAGADPIGRRMRTGGMDSKGDVFATIIGIVGDVRFHSLDTPPAPAYYITHAQRTDGLLNMTLLVRSSGNPDALAAPVRTLIRSLDGDVAIDVETLRARVGESFTDRRFMLLVLGVFAASALLLAAVGIYGVVAFAVAQRTREIGIRMALGAAAPRVLWTIIRGTMLSIAAGITAGLAGATALARVAASFLYEIDPVDPRTFAAVALILIVVAVIAMLVPARRALRVTPLTALRGE